MKRYMLHRNDIPHGGNYRILPHPDGEYYLASEVDARVEALEWLVEVQEYVLGDLSTKTWEVLLNREYVHPAHREMWATLQAARAAAGV